MLMFGRKQQNSVKQLSFNKKNKEKSIFCIIWTDNMCSMVIIKEERYHLQNKQWGE